MLYSLEVLVGVFMGLAIQYKPIDLDNGHPDMKDRITVTAEKSLNLGRKEIWKYFLVWVFIGIIVDVSLGSLVCFVNCSRLLQKYN